MGRSWKARWLGKPEDINGAVRAAELKEPSGSQLERWRNARLLPSVRQLPAAYHGSTVEYPRGTAQQTARLMELLRDKETFEHAG
jgi:hypothetical protein